MQVVQEVMHMGILRSEDTWEAAVREKAKRTIYSIMRSGLHGYNGVYTETSINLPNIYVLLVLVYGRSCLT